MGTCSPFVSLGNAAAATADKSSGIRQRDLNFPFSREKNAESLERKDGESVVTAGFSERPSRKPVPHVRC